MIKSRWLGWTGNVIRTREKRNAYGFGGKARRKETTKKTRHRWENNIKMNQEIGWCGIDWIDLAQDVDQWTALLNTVMNLRVSIEILEIVEKLRNWRLFKTGSDPGC
jgi:hypothetical protein